MGYGNGPDEKEKDKDREGYGKGMGFDRFWDIEMGQMRRKWREREESMGREWDMVAFGIWKWGRR